MSDPPSNNSTTKEGGSPGKKRAFGSTAKTSTTKTNSSSMKTATQTSSSTTKTSETSGSKTTTTTSSSTTQKSAHTQNSASKDLSECTLSLRGTILTIQWNDGEDRAVTVNLNQYVAYVDDELQWVPRGTGGFRSGCKYKSIRLDETLLRCENRSDEEASLDLSEYITFNSDTDLFEPLELEFTLMGGEKIVESSRSLLDITLISSFNLAQLLRDPAFHKAITDVAERAESDAHDERLAVMNKMNEESEEINKEVKELQERLKEVVSRSEKATKEMEEQLEVINKKSTERFEREMTTLINAVAKMALKAVYAQIRELNLKVLTVEQQKAYEAHWSSSPPPYPAEGTTGSA